MELNGMPATAASPIDAEQQRRCCDLCEHEWAELLHGLHQLDPKPRQKLTWAFLLLLFLELSREERSKLLTMILTGTYFPDDQQTPLAPQ
jgi:hypothetical protein